MKRQGTITVGKNFPIKSGDTFVFRNRHGRVTSLHRVTLVQGEEGKTARFAETEVTDAVCQ